MTRAPRADPTSPQDPVEAKARFLFSHAALFNLIAGALVLLANANRMVATTIGLKGLPTDGWALHFTAASVLIFGWMYWVIGRDPKRHRAMIQFGVVGKLLTVAIIWGHWFNGDVEWRLAAIAACDAVYAALFWRARKSLA